MKENARKLVEETSQMVTMVGMRSHYQERVSASDFKDTAAPRFGHSDVVFDLLIETRCFHLIALLSNFSFFLFFSQVFRVHNDLISYKKYHKITFIKHSC